MRIFVYDRQNADAVSAMRKLTPREGLKANQFVPVTEAEYAALRDSMMCIEIDDPPKSPTPQGEAGNGNETEQTPFSGN